MMTIKTVIKNFCIEFLSFGFKQAWACLFGGLLLALILITHFLWRPDFPLARYDALFIGAVIIQIGLLLFRLETLHEAKVILVFHVIGTIMEIFKTYMGSWAYPEENIIRIGGVPLFSGFMYAAVGSYIARVTRIMDMQYIHYPHTGILAVLGCAIYANFFTHHFMPDMRGLLFLIVGTVFGKTWVYYRPYKVMRRMPLVLGFALVTFFIWIAENIGTFGMIWVYPHQKNVWHMVSFAKMGSWFLLMIISFILVSLVHRPKEYRPQA